MHACPHCQVELPEKAPFCGACGRRIEGWAQVPRPAADGPLPGGEEPTRQMEPTSSLLRAAAAPRSRRGPTADGPVETESAMMRAVKRNWAPIVVTSVLSATVAGVGAFTLLKHPPPAEAPASPAPPPPVAEAPAPPPPAAAVPSAPKKRRVRLTPDTKTRVATGKKTDKTGLPHKTVAVDTQPAKPAGDARPEPKRPEETKSTAPPPEDLPSEATPLTEEELKAQGEASINADHVRFVVRSHMAQVRSCYDRANKNFNLTGTVEIAFAITPEGKATRVRTEENTTGSELLAKCLAARISEWQFPRPVGGEYDLIYPFQFGSP